MVRFRRWILYGILLFAFSVILRGEGQEIRAYTVSDSGVRYLIYLDDQEFEVTQGQYIILSELQDSTAEMYWYLVSILGDRMPEDFSTVSGRIAAGGSAGLSEPTAAPVPTPTAGTGEEDDSAFVIQDGRLIGYRGSSAAVRIPSTVTAIDTLAFYRNSGVKSIYVPASVKTVDNGAFYRCPALRFIQFENGDLSAGKNMIVNCDKLVNLAAPKGSRAYQYALDNDIAVTGTFQIRLDRKNCYLIRGDSQKIYVYNNIYKVKWKSSKPGVASVTSTGKVKAKKPGKAKITAAVNGKKYSCQIRVSPRGVDTRINQIIRSEIKSGMSRYDKVKAIHNWLIRNVKYDYYSYLRGNVPHVSHTIRGALVKKVAVCDGYARAFQEIMKKLKIPCKFVVGRSSGVGHAWNMVKLGGKWYHVDATFDDPIINETNTNTTPYYKYFLKSSATMKKSHHWVVGNYPRCTSKKYE